MAIHTDRQIDNRKHAMYRQTETQASRQTDRQAYEQTYTYFIYLSLRAIRMLSKDGVKTLPTCWILATSRKFKHIQDHIDYKVCTTAIPNPKQTNMVKSMTA